MNTLNRNQVLDLIWKEPYKIGHWVGFKDLTPMHNDWLRGFLFETEDQTLQGHRGSYKTTILALFLVLHTIIMPNETVMFFRKTSGDVSEVIRTTANIMRTGCISEIVKSLYHKDFILTKASAYEIQTNLSTNIGGVSQIVGLGIEASITGKHADIVVTDDIVNVNDRTSRAEREKTKIAYMELQNIKNRGGRFINTGTPWHKDDCFQLMPNQKKYDCYSTGLISKENLEKIKSSMLPSLFACNYELRHIASEDVIFVNPVIDGEPEKVMFAKFCHIDAAYDGEDYTAFTICKKVDGKYYVFGKMWRKHIDDCEDEIIKWRKYFNAGKIYNETNADKGYLAKQLRRKGERVVEYWEDMNKYLKIVTYLKGEWKNIVFVKGTDKEYIDQILEYNENAEHDDAPDSLASIIRVLWAKKTGWHMQGTENPFL